MLRVVGADLDVGELGGRHAHPPALAVGEPEHLALGGHCFLDGADELVAVGVLGHVDLDLLRRIGDADPDFHRLTPPDAGSERHYRPVIRMLVEARAPAPGLPAPAAGPSDRSGASAD